RTRRPGAHAPGAALRPAPRIRRSRSGRLKHPARPARVHQDATPREPVHGHRGPSRELFIYYRITSSAAAAAREIVDVYQARLQVRHPGLTARLLHRPDEQLGRQTLMETYKHVAAGGVDDALAAEI